MINVVLYAAEDPEVKYEFLMDEKEIGGANLSRDYRKISECLMHISGIKDIQMNKNRGGDSWIGSFIKHDKEINKDMRWNIMMSYYDKSSLEEFKEFLEEDL